MQDQKSKTIAEMLASINEAENGDTAFLVAAAFNLYAEAIRRKQGRVLLNTKDIESLFTIINYLMNPPMEVIQKAIKPTMPTAEEIKAIETAGHEGEAEIPFVKVR